jgi:small multidrug resistance pump
MNIFSLYLLLGIITEVLGDVCMKLADGFSNILFSVLAFVFYGATLCFLILVLKKLDISVTYAIWGGGGTALIAIIGFVFFKEPVTISRIIFITMIIIGIVGLHLS